MTEYKVTAPAAGYSGPLGGVQFIDTVVVIDEATHPAELAYVRQAGYQVEELVPVDSELPAAPELPKKSAGAAAWRAYAVEHGGMTEADAAALSRDQLVERFTSIEEHS